MGVTVRFSLGDATLDNGRWASDNPALADLLDALREGGSPSDPHPDYTEAARLADLCGGEIIADDGPPKTKPGRIY